jgi:hypothetical protein
LFDLVGLQFSPRIRDMADQRLFHLDRSIHYDEKELRIPRQTPKSMPSAMYSTRQGVSQYAAHGDDLARHRGRRADLGRFVKARV